MRENHKLFISVIIPAYNAEKYIVEALNSILNQSYPHFEILIADDASHDKTKEIIDSFSDERIKTYHNQENLRKPLTVKKLFSFSKGNLITFHDADDISLPNRFEKVVSMFEKQPEIGMCGHDIERISEEGRPLGLYRRKSSSFEEIKKMMQNENTDGDPSMFVRRGVLESLGIIFRPYFQNNMDYDLALRIIEKYPSTNIQEVLSYYRNVPGSISKGIDDFRKLTTQSMTKFFAMERSKTGKDALMREDWEIIKVKEKEFAKPYIKDKSLYLREMASFFMYIKMNKTAIKYVLKAVCLEPFKWINWSTLQYCIRKSLLRV